jgi:hypothetical protein
VAKAPRAGRMVAGEGDATLGEFFFLLEYADVGIITRFSLL